MTSTAAKGFASCVLSLGLLLGAPAFVAKAGDTKPASAQHAKQKKPVADARNDCKDASTRTRTHTYAKTGNCSTCNPTPLQYDPGQPCKPRPMKPVRQAKTPPPMKMPPDFASPYNCQMVMPEDHDSAGHSLWEAEKTACNQAGYPTPWSDKEISNAPAPTPTPDDRSYRQRILDAGRGLI